MTKNYRPVYVEKETHKKLKRISAETEKSMKAILTEFIDQKHKEVVEQTHIR